MEMSEEVLRCVGKLEIASPKPVGFLCGTLPVVADASSFRLPHSALFPSPSQRMEAPRYRMLPAETDLNTLPLLPNVPEKVSLASSEADSQWEHSSINHDLSRKCEALAVSGLSEYGDEIDVVASTDIMKQIFQIPYSKAQLSIAVHRVGDCLILNTGPEVEDSEMLFRRQGSPCKTHDSSIFSNFAMHSVRAEACDCPPSHHGTSGSKNVMSSPSSHHCRGQYIRQEIQSNLDGESRDVRHDKLCWDSKNNRNKSSKGPFQKAPIVGDSARRPIQDIHKSREIGNNGFQRLLFWQFHNFRMLLGSDLLVFSNEKYVAVSLHLWDIARQVTPMTWLEAWLDNVMASVPELAICYHRNGVVQGYELLKTDEIFLLKGISDDGNPAFHPQIVQQNGLSVLRFLQKNCKQDPGAYWLYKSAGEDVLQLFNLSAVPAPTVHVPDSSLASLMLKMRKNSLLSLGTILYRIGHRLSLSKLARNKEKCLEFFKKCLDVMCDQDNMVMNAHVHEQFARLILNSGDYLETASESVGIVEDDLSASFGALTELGDHSHLAAFSNNKVPSGPRLLASADNLGLTHVEDISPQTVSEPVSLKLTAINHVSQAIKSLRWHRQLIDAGLSQEDDGSEHRDRTWVSNLSSVCACGDTDCIEICDIQEWLPKSRMDGKMWKLVLLLGESYLALGEAYRDDGQLDQVLRIVNLACSLYGSMPQQLEGSNFVSSMGCGSSSQYQLNCPSSIDLSAKHLFWSKAWMLVGDVYVAHHGREKKAVQVREETKEIDSTLYVSEDVIMEVERLKKKLGQFEDNCATCSLINCSCRSDRAASGSSASSSRDASSVLYGRKNQGKPKMKKSGQPSFSSSSEISLEGKGLKEREKKGEDCFSPSSASEGNHGGIFRFLSGLRVGNVEQNLLAAVACYDSAREAIEKFSINSEVWYSIMKKTGWVFNELGRLKLDRGDLLGAELAFADAVKAFKKVSDIMNIILINCNLGHGRRGLAEKLVSRLESVNDHGSGFRQMMKNAKMEYVKALKYYDAAKIELNDLGESADPVLRNEVLTQLAHTYLRLGILLSKEATLKNTTNRKLKSSHTIAKGGKSVDSEISATDAFGRALGLYESLGELRRQEAAFAYFHLGCCHRNSSLMFLGTNKEQAKSSKTGNNACLNSKLHADLAEVNWNKSLRFYGPKSHPAMHLNILLEQSMLLSNFSALSDSSEMMERALQYLLEGRHVIGDETENPSFGGANQALEKYWSHLLELLKGMLATTRDVVNSKAKKLREIYRLALKSKSLLQLRTMHQLWTDPD
ncbi:erythroid differentiation factor-like protein isoform X2 [Wolffia australiana]